MLDRMAAVWYQLGSLSGDPTMQPSDKIMFEIYREEGYNRHFKVVYFTELGEHNKEYEINRALAGEHVSDGFIRQPHADAAKAVIDSLLARMNDGEALGAPDIDRAIQPYSPDPAG